MKDALADPFGVTRAGWIVALAYPGTTWKKVACQGWRFPEAPRI
jgi:hypothetical protein